MADVLIVQSVEGFDDVARDTSLVGQYAMLSALDWFEGFGAGLESDVNASERYSQFKQYLGKLAVPDTDEFKDFSGRIRSAVKGGDLLVFGLEMVNQLDGTLYTVLRSRGYVPRNRLKRPYIYAPDLLLSGNTPRPMVDRVLLQARSCTIGNRVVADAFLHNDVHRNRLEEHGFVSLGEKGRHDWQTPDALTWILGATYPVQQYELVA